MSKKKYNITSIIYDKRGNILSIGKNSYVRTHPLQSKYARLAGMPEKQFLHAEIHAISLCKNLSKAYRIDVMRFDSNGNPANAKPCPVCVQAIKAAGIKEVRYT